MGQGRILVVEDEEDIAELLRFHFTEEGYAVEIATRGAEALKLTRKQLPDLIVLDIMLPGMDGYAVCRELRSTTRTGHIPIIFLTQKDERSDKIAGLELGADDYVTKPFDAEELKLRVKNAIQGHRRTNLSDPRTGLPPKDGPLSRSLSTTCNHSMKRTALWPLTKPYDSRHCC
jgi:DNA-binding response OmpR family regulator